MSSKQSFLGESTHSVDPKHRVFVPKRFQNALTPDDDGDRVVFISGRMNVPGATNMVQIVDLGKKG